MNMLFNNIMATGLLMWAFRCGYFLIQGKIFDTKIDNVQEFMFMGMILVCASIALMLFNQGDNK